MNDAVHEQVKLWALKPLVRSSRRGNPGARMDRGAMKLRPSYSWKKMKEMECFHLPLYLICYSAGWDYLSASVSEAIGWKSSRWAVRRTLSLSKNSPIWYFFIILLTEVRTVPKCPHRCQATYDWIGEPGRHSLSWAAPSFFPFLARSKEREKRVRLSENNSFQISAWVDRREKMNSVLVSR